MRHIIGILLQNEAGALARVAGMFSSRGYNIESLSVAPTNDPTVSRRHALIVRQPDGVRLLDDRSLNGVFVNGARVEGKALQDGDEIVVGRYRLMFVSVAPDAQAAGMSASQSGSVQTIG